MPECQCNIFCLELNLNLISKHKLIIITNYIADAVCVSLPDDKNDGLVVSRTDPESVLVPFKLNVSLSCQNTGRYLRKTATSNFRQCVYDPKPVSHGWMIVLKMHR